MSTARQRPSGPFDHDDIALRRLHPDPLRHAIFFGVIPLSRAVGAFEFQDDDAFRVPVAFQHVDLAAADNELATVLGECGTDHLAVFIVSGGIVDIDVDDHVSGHALAPRVLVFGRHKDRRKQDWVLRTWEPGQRTGDSGLGTEDSVKTQAPTLPVSGSPLSPESSVLSPAFPPLIFPSAS